MSCENLFCHSDTTWKKNNRLEVRPTWTRRLWSEMRQNSGSPLPFRFYSCPIFLWLSCNELKHLMYLDFVSSLGLSAWKACVHVWVYACVCPYGKKKHDRVGVSWVIKSNGRWWCNSYWKRTLIPGLLHDSTEFKCRSWTEQPGHQTLAELHGEISLIPAKQTLGAMNLLQMQDTARAAHLSKHAGRGWPLHWVFSRQMSPLQNLIPQPLKKHKQAHQPRQTWG